MLVMLTVVMLVNRGHRGGRSEVLGLRHCQDFLSSWERDFLERERERERGRGMKDERIEERETVKE